MGKLAAQPERLPIFIAAGVIKESADIDRVAQDKVLAGVVLGGFSRHRNKGENRFHWNQDRQAALNRIKVHNPGAKEAGQYLPEGIKKVHDVGQWALVNVVALQREDPLEALPELAEWAVETGADGVEIDVSCPNLGSNDLLCNDVERTSQIVTAVRRRIGEEPVLSLKVADLPRGLINKYAASNLDTDLVAAINSQFGVSGPIIAPVAERNLAHWKFYLERHHKPDIGVLSVGGISGDRAGGALVYKRVHENHADAAGIAQAAYRAHDFQALTKSMKEGYEAAAGAEAAAMA